MLTITVFPFYSRVPIWYTSPALARASELRFSSVSPAAFFFPRSLSLISLRPVDFCAKWVCPIYQRHGVEMNLLHGTILIPALPNSRYVPPLPRALCSAAVYRLLDELGRWFESLPRAHVTEYILSWSIERGDCNRMNCVLESLRWSFSHRRKRNAKFWESTVN